MNSGTAKQFGDQIKRMREKRGMSIRGLASKAGIDSAALIRIEQGKTCNPLPETLRYLAEGLNVPLGDLFAMAGYVTPADLPSLSYYLRVKYGSLPQDAVDEIERELRQLIDKYHNEETSNLQD